MKGLAGPLLLAMLASLCLAFANGADAFAPMAWIAPVLLLRLTRGPGRLRPFIGYAAFLGAWLFGWAAVLRLDGIELAVAAPIMAGLGFLPYLVDRWAARRLGGLAGTLVFPTATVAMELLFASVSPFGSWGMIGYSQVGILPLAQLAAATGVYGLSFLPGWFAAIVNLVLETRGVAGRWRWPAGAFAALLAVIVAYGAVRLGGAPSGPAIRVAALTPHVQENGNYDAARAPAIQDDLFAQTAAAAANRAELVLWPEDSFFIPATAEPALLARGAAAAHAGHVSIGMLYGVREREGDLRYRNRFVLIGPDGRILWTYDKSFPVPGYEQAHMVPGNGRIAWAYLPGATVAGAICFDGDHRQIMEQVVGGGDGAPLLLLPSDDWPAIVHLHAAMARMRAIEQGVPIVRPTINGTAAIYDGHGRILASRLSLDRPGEALTASILPGPGPTLYAYLGDWFAWTNVAGLVLLVLAGWRTRRRQRRRAT